MEKIKKQDLKIWNLEKLFKGQKRPSEMNLRTIGPTNEAKISQIKGLGEIKKKGLKI